MGSGPQKNQSLRLWVPIANFRRPLTPHVNLPGTHFTRSQILYTGVLLLLTSLVSVIITYLVTKEHLLPVSDDGNKNFSSAAIRNNKYDNDFEAYDYSIVKENIYQCC
jgi:hypothetical protein